MTTGPEPKRPPASLTPNQIVAYNLRWARTVPDWTQEQAAEALAPYLGTRWSVANFSAIERSVDGVRIRHFSADELVALSRGFDLPIGFFLTPAEGQEVRVATPDAHGSGTDPSMMIDALLGTDDNFGIWERLVVRSAAQMATADAASPVVPDQLRRVRRLTRLRAKALLRREFGELDAAHHVLTQVLAVLDDLDVED